jgi:hypothetical protein
MSDHDPRELLGHLERARSRLVAIRAQVDRAIEQDLPRIGKTDNAALIVSGILERYYSCLETFMLRVSQFFENSLTPRRWHADLLEKMRIAIPTVRIPLVSEVNYANLLELLRFRHFNRYYFDAEYDWPRLDYLVQRLKSAHPLVLEDLRVFETFLQKMLEN